MEYFKMVALRAYSISHTGQITVLTPSFSITISDNLISVAGKTLIQ